MNFIDMITNVVVPRWVKALVTSILLLLVIGYSAMTVIGFLQVDRLDGWIEGGAYVLGVLLPVLFAGLVILYAETGISALRRRSYRYLADIIPQFLPILEEPRTTLNRRALSWNELRRVKSGVILKTRPSNGGESVLYSVSIRPDLTSKERKQVTFLIQLNVKKANVVVYLPEALLRSAALGSANLDELFPHALAGALAEGYVLNRELGTETIEGVPHQSYVLFRSLPDRFLVHSTERLYFAQDLMFMLRAMVWERPDLFAAGAKK